jgi:hypothetical protein
MRGQANKLASFPLEHYADSPDDEILVGFQNWQLTVGDVRAAKAAAGVTSSEGESDA